MPTLREIRQRIGGVKSTQKITKAMKMVAAAKLRRAQDAIVAARPYARKLKELLTHLAVTEQVGHIANPLLIPRQVNGVALVVVTADRGLCGAFNSNIVKAAMHHLRENYAVLSEAGNLKLMCVGRKGYDFFNKRNYKVFSKHLGLFAGLEFAQARAIADELVGGYLAGEFDRVEIIYNEFKSVIQQRIVIEQILPVPAETTRPVPEPRRTDDHAKSLVDYIYEPSAADIVGALVPKHLNFQTWRILLESNAAEQGARMSAMENATNNARDLIRALTLSYNKARQASITKELLEIVSGAEALTKAG